MVDATQLQVLGGPWAIPDPWDTFTAARRNPVITSDSFDGAEQVIGSLSDAAFGGTFATWVGMIGSGATAVRSGGRLNLAGNTFVGFELAHQHVLLAGRLGAVPTGSSAAALAGRCASAAASQANTSYRLAVMPGSGTLRIERRSGGATTVLETAPDPVVAGDVIAFRIAGTDTATLRGYVNGVEVVVASDGTIPAGAFVGVSSAAETVSFEEIIVQQITHPNEM